MLKRASVCALAALGLLAGGCVTMPPGPSVMVLPGHDRSFEQFQEDDWTCRGWASQQSGAPAEQAAAEAGVASAAIGTAVGAAAGAAIGAAAGAPATGAAIGAGSGLLFGSAAGAQHAHGAGWAVQQRYDAAYMQCMYAKGNQIPVAGSVLQRRGTPPPPPAGPYRDLPPAPRGSPPPPPPDAG